MRQGRSKASDPAKRPTAKLNHSLEKRLMSYALVASAAGVGALACAPHAEAKVVFTNTWLPMGPGLRGTTDLDLNSDGVVDFTISNYRKFCSSKTSGSCARMVIHVVPRASGNAVWGKNSSASALGSGVRIGPNGKFQAGHELMGSERQYFGDSSSRYVSAGPWRQATNRYLGVKFKIQGEVHFGWVRIDVAEAQTGVYSAISGYAYETVPNRPILTGQKNRLSNNNKRKTGSASVDVGVPTSDGLGALAIGALGLQMPGKTR